MTVGPGGGTTVSGGRTMGIMSDFEAMAFIVAAALMVAALALLAVG